ncbi:MAG: hypothetical protein O2848_00860 [Proteobacteria bacterium]|nr:hypothetical protein [Pseudomonadota bacterium]MDA0847393.1 hypothetical protein [Pseudomonadota bacterium]
MTNIKDKLSASVRQSKLATPAAATPTAAKPQGRDAASRPVASETTPKAAGSKAKAMQPPTAQASGGGGFAFPDRIWPD